MSFFHKKRQLLGWYKNTQSFKRFDKEIPLPKIETKEWLIKSYVLTPGTDTTLKETHLQKETPLQKCKPKLKAEIKSN